MEPKYEAMKFFEHVNEEKDRLQAAFPAVAVLQLVSTLWPKDSGPATKTRIPFRESLHSGLDADGAPRQAVLAFRRKAGPLQRSVKFWGDILLVSISRPTHPHKREVTHFGELGLASRVSCGLQLVRLLWAELGGIECPQWLSGDLGRDELRLRAREPLRQGMVLWVLCLVAFVLSSPEFHHLLTTSRLEIRGSSERSPADVTNSTEEGNPSNEQT